MIENYTLQLGEDSGLALTKRIYDISNPAARQSHFTKTITVPSSQENDRLFAALFDVNFYVDSDTQFAPYFNPAKKAPCIIHTDTIEQINGYAQLTDIVITGEKVEYKITVYGEVRDLFAELADKRLSDLDLSIYNHNYTLANIENSWDYIVKVDGMDSNIGEPGTGYVYPMVDYGDDHTLYLSGTPVVITTDYWKAEHFRPWLYVKTIVDAIFQQSTTFSYYSEFFNSTLFKKLIYQGDANGLKKQDSEIEAGTINATKTSTTTYNGITNTVTGGAAYTNYPIIYNTVQLDPSSQYNNTTGTITIDANDRYVFGSRIYFTLTNNSSATLDGTIRVTFALIKSDGTPIQMVVKDVFIGGAPDPVLNLDPTDTVSSDAEFSYTVASRLEATDEVRWCVYRIEHLRASPYSPQSVGGVGITLLDSGYEMFMTPVANLLEGSQINVNGILDPEMTQKDFMMNLVKMFNLYVEPYWFRSGDANSGKYNQYLIEPRDDYFTDDVIDWTQNLDTSREFTIKPLALVDSKYFHFTYKEDNDFLNDLYKSQTGRIYGDYIHEIDSDFVTQTKKIEVTFTPCIMSDQVNKNVKRLMPTNLAQSGGTREDGKPKILFYTGSQVCSEYWFGNEKFVRYGLAHTLDDPDDPTCDLNFQLPPIIYYKGNNKGEVTFTNGTLFNRYYYRQMIETTDVNSKLVECYMRLKPADIHNLSFRPLYFIRNAYYRLYEVVDHKYTETTLCRFLKINIASPITNQTTTTRGGKGTIIGVGQSVPDRTPTKAGIPIDWVVNRGKFVDPDNGGTVIADGNIGTGWVNGLSGGGGTIYGGTYTGEVAKSDTIYLGMPYTNVASGATVLTGLEGSPYYVIADTSTGDASIWLPDEGEFEGSIVYVVKTSASNTVFVYDFGDALVDSWTAEDESHQFLLTPDGAIVL